MCRDWRRAAFSERSSLSGIEVVFTGEAYAAACGFPEARTRGITDVETRDCTCCRLWAGVYIEYYFVVSSGRLFGRACLLGWSKQRRGQVPLAGVSVAPALSLTCFELKPSRVSSSACASAFRPPRARSVDLQSSSASPPPARLVSLPRVAYCTRVLNHLSHHFPTTCQVSCHAVTRAGRQ